MYDSSLITTAFAEFIAQNQAIDVGLQRTQLFIRGPDPLDAKRGRDRKRTMTVQGSSEAPVFIGLVMIEDHELTISDLRIGVDRSPFREPLLVDRIKFVLHLPLNLLELPVKTMIEEMPDVVGEVLLIPVGCLHVEITREFKRNPISVAWGLALRLAHATPELVKDSQGPKGVSPVLR